MPEVYVWNASRLVGFRGFVVRINQRFVRVVVMFVGAFLRLPPVGVLIDPLYHLWLWDQAWVSNDRLKGSWTLHHRGPQRHSPQRGRW